MTTTDPKQNTDPDTLIVLDGIRGITHKDARKFLDGKRDLLDANSNAHEYLTLAEEYGAIGANEEAAEMYQEYEARRGK